MRLLRKAGIRHLARHPMQLVLALLGVALGVAVVVAMDLSIASSREALRVSAETIAGRATHRVIGGPAGLPDSLPALLRVRGGVRAAAPVVEGYATADALPGRPLRILGVDPFSEAPFRPYLAGGPGGEVDGTRLLVEAGAAFLSRTTADALGVEAGDPLPVRTDRGPGELRIAGVLEPEDGWSRRGLRDLLVVDVSEAQDLLGRDERLDRVDLILPDGPEGEARAAVLEALLPPEARLEPAGARAGALEAMIRGFDVNLRALSLLALLFGVFLIYNTLTFSVVQRRGVLGTFRALGVPGTAILRSVLGEAALLGAAGSALGLLLGVVLGRGLVRMVTRTINDLYFVVSVEGLAVSGGALAKGAALGIGATLLAALPPAWEAARTTPREAMTRSTVEEGVRTLVRRAGAAGALLIAAGAGLLLVPGDGLLPAFAGLFGLVVGMALLSPLATVGAIALLRPPLRRFTGVVGGMAARGVVTSLSRTGPAMAALVIAVAVTIGIGVVIESFRGSVVRWLDTTLQADLYVSSPAPVPTGGGGRLSPVLAAGADAVPGVAGVSRYRAVELGTRHPGARLMAVDLDPRGERGFHLLSGDGPGAIAAFRGGEGLLISEPFAVRSGLGPGDTLALAGEGGPVPLPVLAVFRDYGSDAGTVMIARSVYARHWSDPVVTSMAIFLEPGGDAEEVEAGLRALAGPEAPVVIRPNRELRARSLEVFDRTFAVTRVLRVLAFLVAFIAVLSALAALQLERGREMGVLRANGMTPGQTWGLVAGQTGIMGGLAGVLAVPVGLVVAAVMVLVVNRRAFGWTLELTLGPEHVVQAVGLALAGALLAAVYPAWRMSRTPVAGALRGE